MTLSKIGRILLALVASAALGLGMTACGGGTIGYMWVLGTQYNQITGFKIDDYTGNLTQSPHSPFSSGGVNPQNIVLKAGGRFVYVINTGTPATVSTTTGLPSTSTPGNIAEFSVGGDGQLTFQQNFSSQGTTPVWAAIDSTGSFLYVMDKYSPAYCSLAKCTITDATSPTLCALANCSGGTPASLPLNNDLRGSITSFAIAGDTGRLTLVTNLQQKVNTIISTSTNPLAQLTFFEVGVAPTMVKIASSGCMYALSGQSVYALSVNSSNGQLTVPATSSTQITTNGNFSSINTSGSYIYITDSTNNTILPLTSNATACALSTAGTGIIKNLALTANPVQSLTSTNGKFLYVVNQTSTAQLTPANSTISVFTIDSNGSLAPLADSANPYAIGSGPVCVAADPTNQYLYTSNNTDSTVTGKIANANTGILSDLSRGSVFPTTGKPTCMIVSGNI